MASKIPYLIALTIVNFFLLLNAAVANMELEIESNKKSRPLLEGNGVHYEWEITNVGTKNISSLSLNFILYNPDSERPAINRTCKVLFLSIGNTVTCESPKRQLSETGIYNLLIYPKAAEKVVINDYDTSEANWIFDSFRVFSYTELATIIGVVFTFIIVWNQFLKGSNIWVGHPINYRLYTNKRPGNVYKLIMEMPFIFENDGARSSAISDLFLILKSKNKRYVFKWKSELDGHIWKPPTQFVVPSRNHTQKTIQFEVDFDNNFASDLYKVQLVSYEGGLDFRRRLITFKTKLEISKQYTDFTFWKETYEREKKTTTLQRINFILLDKLPKGYVKLSIRVIEFFKRFFS